MPNDKGLMSEKLRNDMKGMAAMADAQVGPGGKKAMAGKTSNSPPPKYAGMAGSSVPVNKPKAKAKAASMKMKKKMREGTQKELTRVGKKGSEISNAKKEMMIASRKRLK